MGYGMSIIEDNGYFIFDGIKSSDYGVWINGRETFNAPARRYNEYVVPGRNGTLTIDGGSFEDLEVTYPAFIVENFGANIEAFRNQLMTKTGYVRMTDSYHPDEYYLAKYMSGLEANVLPKGAAGSFDLTFKRDPRRFLVSGETPVTISSNNSQAITNPTLFDSDPLIRVEFSEPAELISQPYYVQNNPYNHNGVAYTNNNGAITVNGTASARSWYTLKYHASNLSPGTYHLQGCPTSGSITTYYLCVWLSNSSGTVQSFYDTGNGFNVTITEALSQYEWIAQIYVESGTTVNDIIFNPSLIPTTIDECVLFIGADNIKLKPVYDYIDIDSEIQDCYCGTQNANSVVSFATGEFPKLPPGTTGVLLGAGISNIQITPRWYRV